MKLRGMAVVVGRDVESSGRQRELLEAIRDERPILPAGCEVTYETTAIDILQHLLRPTRTEEAMQSFYRDFEERNGVRPLAVETFHAGLSPRSNSERSWLSFVERMGGLNTAEKVAWSTAREFLISLEKTEISRSYKIVLLQAMLEGDTLTPSLPIALRRLGDLEGNLSLRVYEAHTKGFHLKSYVFMNVSEGIAFVGSSNLSGPALTTSIEWNYKIVSSRDTRGFREIRDGFEALFSNPASVPASEDWITRYELRRRIPALGESTVVDELPEPKPQPHAIQLQALAQLEQTREDGFTAGLVVLATGLGKTWLAAFDSDSPHFRRVLFVAHREEILNQAIQSFRRIRPDASIGRLAGEQRDIDAELVFASVQTLGRVNHLSGFRRDDFDYIVVDEFHHAAAASYRRIIDYFQPKFLLGLWEQGIKAIKGSLIRLPSRISDRPDKDRLAQRYELFKQQI